MTNGNGNGDRAREPDGRFAEATVASVYDSLAREVKRIDQLRTADQVAVAAALQSADKATQIGITATKEASNKAEEYQRKVNESQNEFRQQLKDQAATLMPRSESEAVHAVFRTDIADIRHKMDVLAGAAAGSAATWAIVLSVGAVVGAIAGAIAAIVLK